MMRSDITLVTGGARSGKSTFAEKLIQKRNLKQFYIATAEILDEEMQLRIQHHIKNRGDNWDTIEEPVYIAKIIKQISRQDNIILVDCLTLWLSNIMSEKKCLKTFFDDLTKVIMSAEGPIVLVTNEVGMGIVPSNFLAREFRDNAGRLNQIIANLADNVYFLAAGLPIQLKKDGKGVTVL